MALLMRRATESSGGGDTEWVPCPTGVRRFKVGKPQIKPSGFKNKDGSDKYAVTFPLALTDEEYKRAQEEVGELADGQQLSGRTRCRAGLSLGFYRDGRYQQTALVEFLITLLGSKQQAALLKYLENGGGPVLTEAMSDDEQIAVIQDWLEWFEECEVYGEITHRPDKNEPKKIWTDFGKPTAVGGLPGLPEAAYQKWGAERLGQLVENGEQPLSDAEKDVAEGAAVAAKYTATGELIDAAAEDVTEEAHPKGCRCQACYDELFGKAG